MSVRKVKTNWPKLFGRKSELAGNRIRYMHTHYAHSHRHLYTSICEALIYIVYCDGKLLEAV